MRATSAILAAGVATLLATAAVAQGGPPANGRLDGEIVEVRQTQATQNEGATTEILVRTQQRQEQWVRLGPSEEMGNRFRAGDRVRLRTMAGPGGAMLARKVHNFANGTVVTLRDASGALLTRDQIRKQLRDGSGDGTADRTRKRDRIHEPGTGGGSGGGNRHGGGGGGRR